MCKNQIKHRATASLEREVIARQYTVNRERVQCRMLESVDDLHDFSLEIACGKCRARGAAGQSFSAAALLFEQLVEGRVTPVALEGILEDALL